MSFIFNKTNQVIQQRIDDLIVKNARLLEVNKTFGFIFDSVNYIHSDCNPTNFEQQRILRGKMDIPHPDIISDIQDLVADKNRTAIDEMRFKGLINGMLSVVNTNSDFETVFKGMFEPEIEAFNQQYGTTFNENFIMHDENEHTLSNSDMQFVEDTKAKFKVCYDRYRIMTDLLGL